MNYTLHTLKRALQLDTATMLQIFNIANDKITLEDVQDALKDQKQEGFVTLSDEGLLLFLEGLIIYKRGGELDLKIAKNFHLTNNMILKKLRVALKLQDEDLIKIFSSQEKEVKKSELTAFFRKEGHKNYRPLSDKMLRQFLRGLEPFYA
jgi:uncharacterized protein YehS (DUF1456 family)